MWCEHGMGRAARSIAAARLPEGSATPPELHSSQVTRAPTDGCLPTAQNATHRGLGHHIGAQLHHDAAQRGGAWRAEEEGRVASGSGPQPAEAVRDGWARVCKPGRPARRRMHMHAAPRRELYRESCCSCAAGMQPAGTGRSWTAGVGTQRRLRAAAALPLLLTRRHLRGRRNRGRSALHTPSAEPPAPRAPKRSGSPSGIAAGLTSKKTCAWNGGGGGRCEHRRRLRAGARAAGAAGAAALPWGWTWRFRLVAMCLGPSVGAGGGPMVPRRRSQERVHEAEHATRVTALQGPPQGAGCSAHAPTFQLQLAQTDTQLSRGHYEHTSGGAVAAGLLGAQPWPSPDLCGHKVRGAATARPVPHP